MEVEGIGEITGTDIKTKVDWKETEKQVKLAEKNKVGWMTFQDEDYPQNLKQIYDFPPFFFIQGNLTEKDDMAVAIVGTQTASTYGRNMAEKISADLSAKGFTIVLDEPAITDLKFAWIALAVREARTFENQTEIKESVIPDITSLFSPTPIFSPTPVPLIYSPTPQSSDSGLIFPTVATELD